ncbi:MAG: hypothetical protein HQK53_18520 [Oligoflexia bacterium]|nr:hypothetical protein [Oligoflexia bacterium]
MNLLNTKISIELNMAEAIVIANFLARQNDFKNGTANVDNYEKRALWNLECLLEKVLTEPLINNYGDLLNRAKELLADKEED